MRSGGNDGGMMGGIMGREGGFFIFPACLLFSPGGRFAVLDEVWGDSFWGFFLFPAFIFPTLFQLALLSLYFPNSFSRFPFSLLFYPNPIDSLSLFVFFSFFLLLFLLAMGLGIRNGWFGLGYVCVGWCFAYLFCFLDWRVGLDWGGGEV